MKSFCTWCVHTPHHSNSLSPCFKRHKNKDYLFKMVETHVKIKLYVEIFEKIEKNIFCSYISFTKFVLFHLWADSLIFGHMCQFQGILIFFREKHQNLPDISKMNPTDQTYDLGNSKTAKTFKIKHVFIT